MVANWDSIIKYYQEYSHFPRYDAEMWEKLRHHCREMLILIPKIRQHPELQKLNVFIDVNHLLLSNSETNRIASVWIGYEEVIISVFKVGEGLDFAKHKKINAKLSDTVEVLAANLLDN